MRSFYVNIDGQAHKTVPFHARSLTVGQAHDLRHEQRARQAIDEAMLDLAQAEVLIYDLDYYPLPDDLGLMEDIPY